MTSTRISGPRGLDALYYMVKDVDRARKFYEEGLGFKPTAVSDSGGWTGAEYEMPDGQTFGIGKGDGVPWRMCGGAMFSFDDVAAATARVREFGGQVHADSFDTPVCVMSWCEDTEGNTFSLHHRKDGTAG